MVIFPSPKLVLSPKEMMNTGWSPMSSFVFSSIDSGCIGSMRRVAVAVANVLMALQSKDATLPSDRFTLNVVDASEFALSTTNAMLEAWIVTDVESSVMLQSLPSCTSGSTISARYSPARSKVLPFRFSFVAPIGVISLSQKLFP